MQIASFNPARITARIALGAMLFVSSLTALAATQVRDASALKPPPGHNIAIVEFDDLQCPACAQANPVIMSAVAQYKIPWIRHDLLIPMHNWSRLAAINARFFDARSPELGNDYRNQVFANQTSIYTPINLRDFTVKFAQSKGITLPFDMDPGNKFASAVEADNALGQRTGITSTPTIFIVTRDAQGDHFVEVSDRSKLFQMIDAALATLKPAAPARRAVKK